MIDTTVFTVRSLADLVRLPANRDVNGWLLRRPIQLDIPPLPRTELIRYERKLNKYQSRCGCLAGGVAVVIFMLLALIDLLRRDSWLTSLGVLPAALVTLGGALGMGMAVKLATMALTRLQFQIACKLISRRIREALET